MDTDAGIRAHSQRRDQATKARPIAQPQCMC